MGDVAETRAPGEPGPPRAPAAAAGAVQRRLARLRFDLHDGPQQDIHLLAEDLRLFREQLRPMLDGHPDQDRALGRLDDLEAQLLLLDGDLRRLVMTVESPFLTPSSLPDALTGLTQAFAERTGVIPETSLTGPVSSLRTHSRSRCSHWCARRCPTSAGTRMPSGCMIAIEAGDGGHRRCRSRMTAAASIPSRLSSGPRGRVGSGWWACTSGCGCSVAAPRSDPSRGGRRRCRRACRRGRGFRGAVVRPRAGRCRAPARTRGSPGAAQAMPCSSA